MLASSRLSGSMEGGFGEDRGEVGQWGQIRIIDILQLTNARSSEGLRREPYPQAKERFPRTSRGVEMCGPTMCELYGSRPPDIALNS